VSLAYQVKPRARSPSLHSAHDRAGPESAPIHDRQTVSINGRRGSLSDKPPAETATCWHTGDGHRAESQVVRIANGRDATVHGACVRTLLVAVRRANLAPPASCPVSSTPRDPPIKGLALPY
jgi:hypothetical protein